MSLRSIHLAFIISSIVLSIFVSIWGIRMYASSEDSIWHLVFAVVALLSAVGMTLYLVVFVRKTREIGMK
jgi:hypothetical protein